MAWKNNGEVFDFGQPIQGNVNLVAEWVEVTKGIEQYIISFDSAGGTTIPNQIIALGGKITKPKDPTKTNYTFLGWYYNSVVYNFEGLVSQAMVLTAKWEKKKTTTPDPTPTPKPVVILPIPQSLFIKNDYNDYEVPIFSDFQLEGTDGVEIYRSGSLDGNYNKIGTCYNDYVNCGVEEEVDLYSDNYYKARSFKVIDGVKYDSEMMKNPIYVPGFVSKPKDLFVRANGVNFNVSFTESSGANGVIIKYNILSTLINNLNEWHILFEKEISTSYTFNFRDKILNYDDPISFKVCPVVITNNYEMNAPCSDIVATPGQVDYRNINLTYSSSTRLLTIVCPGGADKYSLYFGDSSFADFNNLGEITSSTYTVHPAVQVNDYISVVAIREGSNYRIAASPKYIQITE